MNTGLSFIFGVYSMSPLLCVAMPLTTVETSDGQKAALNFIHR